MNAKEKLLAAKFLDSASDSLSNNGCNDWDFPDDWTQEERSKFVEEYYVFNQTPEDFDMDPLNLNLPDFDVIAFLAHKLREDVK